MNTLTYPGMDCNGIEFYVKDDQVRFIHHGKITNLVDIPFAVIQIIKEEIEKDLEAKAELLFLFPNSEYKRIEMFIKCRFGGLDYTADIDADGNIQPGEYVDCPLRGKCASEGILCKSIRYNNTVLTSLDIKLIKLLTTTLTNSTIADELNIPLGSFHVVKKNLYQKLGNIQTKQELTRIALKLNIISITD